MNNDLPQNSKKMINAAISGNSTEIKKMIEGGVDINTRDNTGATPLLRASLNGHLDVVDALIKAGADVNLQDSDGLTPIWSASENGYSDIVKALIRADANVNISDNYGVMPLAIASENGHSDIVRMLVDAGADVNHQNNRGETAIFLAVEAGHIDIVIMLIMFGADINIANNKGLTPLIISSWNGKAGMVKDLLIAGADVNQQDNNGDSAIFSASQGDHIDIVRMLIEAGADVNIVNVDGLTPISIAAEFALNEIVYELIEAGANINHQDKNGVTPLILATEAGNIDVIKTLLNAGADVYAKNITGKTAIEITTDYRIIKLLKEKVQVSKVMWKGFTQSDIDKFDIIFGEGAENYSICPICLEYVERSEACMYMTHDCSKGGYYHTELYKKYKTSDGYISWCTICNRIAKGHNHYKLANAEAENPTILLLSSNPYETDCSKTSGGGGLPEKLSRFRRFREYALELQDDIDKKRKNEALDELVEEVWNAPLRREGKLLKGIAESKKWNIASNKFTKNTVSANAIAPNIPFTGKLPTKVNSGRNNIMMNENIPVIQFHHKQGNGSEKTHGISEENLIHFIQSKNKEFGTPEFGYCFMYPGSCKSRLHPEELKEYIPKELYEEYKKHFNTKFKGQAGGSNENILHEATDAVCVLIKKDQKGGKKTRRAREAGRKTRKRRSKM